MTHARRLDGGGWELSTQRGETRRVDLLVVANGHHWDPRWPNFPGEFAGDEIHSHSYIDPRTPLDFAGKRILVVGLGNSAADIAVELSSKALDTTVTISTRSSAWIVPKYFAGKPADKYYHTSPYIPFSWQRKFTQIMQPMTAGRPEDYGLPTPNHKSSKHIRRSRSSCRCGSAPVTSPPRATSSDSTATPCTSSTARVPIST